MTPDSFLEWSTSIGAGLVMLAMGGLAAAGAAYLINELRKKMQ